MSRIILLKLDGDEQLEMKLPGDMPWMDLCEKFVNFLQGCGYFVDGKAIATHMADIYGTEDDSDVSDYESVDGGLPSDVLTITLPDGEQHQFDTINITTDTFSTADFGPLSAAIDSWNTANLARADRERDAFTNFNVPTPRI